MRVLCFFPGFQEPQTFLILLLHHPSLPCYSPPVCGCIHIPPCIRTPVIKDWGFPGGAVLKITLTNGEDARDAGLIPVSERSPGEGNGNPLQYSFLENPTDRGAWWATVYGSQRADTTERLNNSAKKESCCHCIPLPKILLKRLKEN